MVLTIAVAVFVSSFQLNANPEGLPFLLCSYALLWIAPSASYGFDKKNTIVGAASAGGYGAVAFAVSLVLLNALLPKVQ